MPVRLQIASVHIDHQPYEVLVAGRILYRFHDYIEQYIIEEID